MKVHLVVEVEPTFDGLLPEQVAGYVEQVIEEDQDSRAIEEAHGVLEPNDRAFDIKDVRLNRGYHPLGRDPRRE